MINLNYNEEILLSKDLKLLNFNVLFGNFKYLLSEFNLSKKYILLFCAALKSIILSPINNVFDLFLYFERILFI